MKKIGIILMSAAMTIVAVSCCNSGKKCGECGESCRCSEKTAAVAAEKPERDKKVIVARMTVNEGQEKAFIDVASKLVEATRQEEGCLFYTLYQSPLNASEFIFYEEYKDQAAFETHGASAHFAAFVEGTKGMSSQGILVGEF
ncbi:MAG: antibiotic biosynthesis monooxygenase [Tannerella sp.]|jgi:quinol monooxygenase YgiN|nr:antibiotic biosynthesis monooxygenase [Tannerella sp.]